MGRNKLEIKKNKISISLNNEVLEQLESLTNNKSSYIEILLCEKFNIITPDKSRETKICKVCKKQKSIDDFNLVKNNKDGHNGKCKECEYDYYKKWVLTNKETRDDYQKFYQKEHYENNKEDRNRQNREWSKQKCLTDPLFRLKKNIRSSISHMFKSKGHIKKSQTTDILGCSFEDFKLYLESKFEPWMTWENYGKYNGELNYGWDIDHIIPMSSSLNEGDIIRLNHYTNLQPLCSHINRDIKK
jgi:hypothetical protein